MKNRNNVDENKASEIERELNKNLADFCTDVMVCPHCGKLVGTLAGIPPVCPYCKKLLRESVFKKIIEFIKKKIE